MPAGQDVILKAIEPSDAFWRAQVLPETNGRKVTFPRQPGCEQASSRQSAPAERGMQGKEAGEGGEGRNARQGSRRGRRGKRAEISESKAGIRCVIDKIIALNITQNHKLHTQIEHTPGHFTHEVEPSRT